MDGCIDTLPVAREWRLNFLCLRGLARTDIAAETSTIHDISRENKANASLILRRTCA